ncbi:MAG: hypothetical protein R3C49_22240 [Planctomycetaceae bacterium]
MGDEYTRRKGQQRKRSGRTRRTGIPLGSSFDDLFSGGASVWLKIVGGAVVTPIAVVVIALRSKRRGGVDLPHDPAVIGISLAGCSVVGAVLGGLLSLKDVVQTRLADGKPVSFPLRLLFGFGIWSLLLVWFPGIIVLTLTVTILLLS